MMKDLDKSNLKKGTTELVASGWAILLWCGQEALRQRLRHP